jgi:hypothetical protein
MHHKNKIKGSFEGKNCWGFKVKEKIIKGKTRDNSLQGDTVSAGDENTKPLRAKSMKVLFEETQYPLGMKMKYH